MSKPEYQLTKKDIKQANDRMLISAIAMFNYQTQNGPNVAYALAPALRKLYPNDEDYKTALLNHFKYFNSQPYTASLIIGAALGMEQELGIEGKDAIQNFKVGLMGPGAGIGDSIFWIILPAIFTPIAAASAYEGSYVGLIIYTLYEIILAVLRYRFFGWGFNMGTNVITKYRKQINVLTDAASVLGLCVLGALIPSTVTIVCPLEFTFSTGSVVNIQSLLDSLVPNLLSIVIAGICAVLLGKRKVTMTTLVLVVLVISIIGSVLGILG